MPIPPFHQFRPKLVGDRVKIPRFPADEPRGYYYGTVVYGRRLADVFVPGGDTLIVEWDEPVPYLGLYSETIVAITDVSDPVWDPLEAWRDTAAHSFA